MTNEEAKNWLNKLYARADITDEYGDMEDMQPYEEALEMAIKALDQETCGDLINKADTFKAMSNTWSHICYVARRKKPTKGEEAVYSDMVGTVKNLPLVTADPCPNVISRSDMLDAIGHGKTYTSEELQKIIKALPPVNPQTKVGHWIGVNPMVDTLMCSECGENIISEEFKSNFCPNCGAKMSEIPTGSEREDEG